MQVEADFRVPVRLIALGLVSAALAAGMIACHHAPGPDVVAKVNGKDILRADLEKYYRGTLSEDQPEPTPEQANILRLNVLKGMIDDEIIQQRAAKLNLAASDEDVNAKLTEMKVPLTQEEFDKQLKARGITVDDLKRDIRRSLTKTKLMNKEIQSKINITDAEITAYYAAHKAEFNLIEPRYNLLQIAVLAGPAQQTANLQSNKANSEADAKKKIQTLHSRVESGEDFGAVAMNFSENKNFASNGGDMGFIPETQLRENPEVYNAVSKLKPGQITDIIPAVDGTGPSKRVIGYAIYKLAAREPAGQRELYDPRVQQAIRQGLRENQAQLLQAAYFEMLRDEAQVHNYLADQILKQGAH